MDASCGCWEESTTRGRLTLLAASSKGVPERGGKALIFSSFHTLPFYFQGAAGNKLSAWLTMQSKAEPAQTVDLRANGLGTGTQVSHLLCNKEASQPVRKS